MAYQKLQAYRAAAVTPSNTVDIPSVSTQDGTGNNGCVLYVGGDGDVKVTTAGGDEVTFVGLSAGTLSFDTVQGMKTATEVISQDSKTARTIKSNKNLLVETIENLIHSIISLAVFIKQLPKREYELTVSFKDSIIIDDNTLIDNNIKLVQAGLKSKISAIMEVQKCDEATAQKELERINKEQSITGLDVDDFTNKKEVDENDENGNTTT